MQAAQVLSDTQSEVKLQAMPGISAAMAVSPWGRQQTSSQSVCFPEGAHVPVEHMPEQMKGPLCCKAGGPEVQAVPMPVQRRGSIHDA